MAVKDHFGDVKRKTPPPTVSGGRTYPQHGHFIGGPAQRALG